MESDPRLSDDAIDRREALRRTAMLLGASLSAPAIAGVLAGCSSRIEESWTPLALTPEQGELVAMIAEQVIPETDTPGARAAGVHVFIDRMLAEHYPAVVRQRVLDGLADIDERARRGCGGPFIRCGADAQRALLARIDEEAFASTSGGGEPHYFRTLKELTLLGYYTSEIGATQELRHVRVPGRFEACVPLSKIGRAWAV